MFGSTVLEIAIGLMFIYLVLSLVCSKINEYIVAHLRSWRADTLEQTLSNLLDNEALKNELYAHPLIKSLGTAKAKPSYIPSHLFSLALLDIVDTKVSSDLVRGSGSNRTGLASVDTAKSKEDADISPPTPPLANAPEPGASGIVAQEKEGPGAAVPPPPPATVPAPNTPVGQKLDAVKQQIDTLTADLQASSLPPQLTKALSVFVKEAEADTDKIRKNVEGWFNESMERASGVYKRKTQLIILVIALVATVFANADTIMIVNRLSQETTLRAAATAAADKIIHSSKTGDTPTLDSTQISQLNMTIGWSNDVNDLRHFPGCTTESASSPKIDGAKFFQELPMKLIGLAITVFAVSMGAPFWFDLLGKLVNMRNAGRNPTEAPKNQTKTPPANSTPA